MSEEAVFTASNGITVTIDSNGYLLAKGGVLGGVTHATGGADFGVQALREYFQHERDQELGRWRDPENPDMVVYPEPGRGGTGECWVVSEKYPLENQSWSRWEIAENRYPSAFGHDTAKRYFEAHPETKPWHEARPGEVWLVTLGEQEPELALTNDSRAGTVFSNVESSWTSVISPAITHAEKIYPKDEENK